VIVWMRRTKLANGPTILHAFEDGKGLCRASRIPIGSASPYQGRPVRAFEPAPLTSLGHPCGPLCAICMGTLRRRAIREELPFAKDAQRKDVAS
jgi:hypothetical protein